MFTFLTEVATAPEGVELITSLVEAAKGGHWSLFVSLLIMVIVFAFTKVPFIGSFLEKKGMKVWVAAIAGMLTAFATNLFMAVSAGESVEWVRLVVDGLSVGLAAGGLWDLLGKKLLGKKGEGEATFNDDPEPEE